MFLSFSIGIDKGMVFISQREGEHLELSPFAQEDSIKRKITEFLKKTITKQEPFKQAKEFLIERYNMCKKDMSDPYKTIFSITVDI